MTEQFREILATGLRYAYAIEADALEMLERQTGALHDDPQLKAKVEEHLRQTERQIERLEKCLEIIGEDPAEIKDTPIVPLGNLLALANGMADDAVLRNKIASISFANYEVGVYASLLQLVQQAGIFEMTDILKKSLEEERAMANLWAGSLSK